MVRADTTRGEKSERITNGNIEQQIVSPPLAVAKIDFIKYPFSPVNIRVSDGKGKIGTQYKKTHIDP